MNLAQANLTRVMAKAILLLDAMHNARFSIEMAKI